MTTTATKTKTTIINSFTGYNATIRTNGLPAVATIRKHIRKSKSSDCRSVTLISIEGDRYELRDLGRGLTLIQL